MAEYLSLSTAESCRHDGSATAYVLALQPARGLVGTRAPGSAAHSRGRSERARKAAVHGDLHASILEPDRLTQAACGVVAWSSTTWSWWCETPWSSTSSYVRRTRQLQERASPPVFKHYGQRPASGNGDPFSVWHASEASMG